MSRSRVFIFSRKVYLAAAAAMCCLIPAAAQDQPRSACIFREGFHVPAQLRNERDPAVRTVLTAGTPVRLRFRDTVSSKRVSTGDPVELEVLEEIQVGGLPVILQGAQAWGIVHGTRRPGLRWEWQVYDDHAPPTVLGHAGESPVARLSGGELVVEIQVSLDLTGGEVGLTSVERARGEDAAPGDPVSAMFGISALSAMEGLYRATAKGLGKKPKWSFFRLAGGKDAAIPKDTEITAFVEEAICYDTAFLHRVQEQMNATKAGNSSASTGGR